MSLLRLDKELTLRQLTEGRLSMARGKFTQDDHGAVRGTFLTATTYSLRGLTRRNMQLRLSALLLHHHSATRDVCMH